MKITDIFQYPVKGLSEAPLKQVDLDRASGMPADRLFAITHGNSKFDYDKPVWIARRNFVVVAHSPEVGPVNCHYEPTGKMLTLTHAGKHLLQERIDTETINEHLSEALTGVITDGQTGPYRLVTLGQSRLTDIPTPTVSLMNTRSLTAVEHAIGESLQMRRFRGNIWFDGDSPWQEHDWVGGSIQIGDVTLQVTERIERCAAVDADPLLGQRNLSVLKQLKQSFGHVDFGVLAQVTVPGRIQQGDTITRL